MVSFLLAVAMLFSTFGIYMSNMKEVKAAGKNPKYMAEIAPVDSVSTKSDNYLRKSLKYISGATYTFSCYFYTKSSETGTQKDSSKDNLVACFDCARGWNVSTANTSGVYGEVGTLILTYTVTEQDEWLAFRIINNSSDPFYIWNLKMTVSTGDSINFDNADFAKEDGSWINWQIRTYFESQNKEWYTVVNNKEESVAAANYTGHKIHEYDCTSFGFLPDYTQLPGYVWDATKKELTFEDTETFNLADISEYHLAQDGKVFIGWTRNDIFLSKEQVTTEQTFEKGDVIKAEYIDCNFENNGDFAICSEEMRTDGNLGVRFVVEMSNKLFNTLPGFGEYGTVVLPSKILDENETPWTMKLLRTTEAEQYYGKVVCEGKWADLKCDGQYSYKGTTYEPAVVKAEHTYETLEDRILYTLCITGLTEEKYDRQYMVKGYVRYVDKNGVERVLYTDYASTSPYLVSKKALDSGKVSDVLSSIQSFVENQYNNTRTSMENGRSEFTPTSGATKGSSETIYQLTNGMKVREVVIDSEKAGEAIEIMHLSDLHLGYMNAYDFADAYPTLLATYNLRTGKDNQGKNAANDRIVLEYARAADQLVVTGDTLDYLSKGAAELTYREIWDKFPNALMALGNHEISQIVSKTVNETLNQQQIYEKIQNIWKSEYLYSKKLLADKILIIQLHNAANEFYAEQYARLLDDLTEARSKGYKVLLFMHEPLVTGNAADTNVKPLWTGDKAEYNFYTASPYSNVYPSKNENTGKVYNLITDNADIVAGVFNGHIHTSFYTEIKGTGTNGTNYVIPQYTSAASYQLNATKIIIN